jgi:hypothetical protein
VAATVNVGASADPRSLPGLARKLSLLSNHTTTAMLLLDEAVVVRIVGHC